MKKYLLFFFLAFTITVAFYYVLGWSQLPEGHGYVYPIDDAYIHLAISKNFAEYGVWSVNTTGFDSSSSSILYTLLLAFCFKVFGNWDYYPMLINLLFGYATVYMIWRYFKEFYGTREMKWVLFLFLPFTLLYAMVIFGMEHVIHMFLTVCALYGIRKNEEREFSGRYFGNLFLLVFLLGMVRFESMFFTVTLAFVLVLRRKWSQGFAVVAAGFLPILLFGWLAVENGGLFFPNSVMVKGSYPAEGGLIASLWMILKKGIFLNFSFYKYLFFPLIIVGFLIFKPPFSLKKTITLRTPEIVIFLTALFQACFAMIEYRYESYLMISLLLLVVPVTSQLQKRQLFSNFRNVILFCSFFGMILISAYRFYYFHRTLQFAPKNILEQQVEMSRFLNKYYQGEKIVANDIGAIAYYGNVQLLDIVGLGSTEIASKVVELKNVPKKKKEEAMHHFLKNHIRNSGYKIAVVYPDWFPDGVPENWIPVATWTISQNRSAARDTVVFYALNKNEVGKLQKSLRKFNLSPEVNQNFLIKN